MSGLDPVILHADGTDCLHDGTPRLGSGGGQCCPAGQRVTHVRFNGQVVTIEAAVASIAAFGRSVAQALTPVITGITEWAAKVCDDPAIRALAAAASVISEERQRAAHDG